MTVCIVIFALPGSCVAQVEEMRRPNSRRTVKSDKGSSGDTTGARRVMLDVNICESLTIFWNGSTVKHFASNRYFLSPVATQRERSDSIFDLWCFIS